MRQHTPDGEFVASVARADLTDAAHNVARAWIEQDFGRLWAITREVDARVLVVAILGPMTTLAAHHFEEGAQGLVTWLEEAHLEALAAGMGESEPPRGTDEF